MINSICISVFSHALVVCAFSSAVSCCGILFMATCCNEISDCCTLYLWSSGRPCCLNNFPLCLTGKGKGDCLRIGAPCIREWTRKRERGLAVHTRTHTRTHIYIQRIFNLFTAGATWAGGYIWQALMDKWVVLFILWKTFLACLTGVYCIINNNNKTNSTIFFSHSLLTLIRK